MLNAPDNLCVSPRGGLVLCEDGGGAEFVHGLTTDGVIFQFAQNNVDLRTTPVVRVQPGLTGFRVRRRVLQPGRQVAVLQHPVAGHHVRGDGSVGERRAVKRRATTGLSEGEPGN